MVVHGRPEEILVRIRLARLRPTEAADDQESQRCQGCQTAQRAADDRAHGRRRAPAALRRSRDN